MAQIETLLVDEWEHTAGDDRVELILARDPDLNSRAQDIALAVVTESGHEAAFTHIVDTVAKMRADPAQRSDMPFKHLTDEGWMSMLALRFLSAEGLSDQLVDRLEAAPEADVATDDMSPAP